MLTSISSFMASLVKKDHGSELSWISHMLTNPPRELSKQRSFKISKISKSLLINSSNVKMLTISIKRSSSRSSRETTTTLNLSKHILRCFKNGMETLPSTLKTWTRSSSLANPGNWEKDLSWELKLNRAIWKSISLTSQMKRLEIAKKVFQKSKQPLQKVRRVFKLT